MSERLHKVLAQSGLGSRREIERWIDAGRVRLNGQPVQVGAQFAAGDRVAIDGDDITTRLHSAMAAQVVAQVIMYHKPQHQPVLPVATAQDVADAGADALKQSVMERLPAKRGTRWLAINTMQSGDSGLLLLTTDGRLADALRRRATTIAAAYVARVLVPASDFDVAGLPLTVRYDEGLVEFASIEAAGGAGANRWFRIEAAHSHRRAAVRALFESRGLGVSRVAQVRFGTLELPRDLPRGKHRALTGGEMRELYELAELSLPVSEQPRARRAKMSNAVLKAKLKRPSIDRSGGRSGRRPGGKSPRRPQRTRSSRKPDR